MNQSRPIRSLFVTALLLAVAAVGGCSKVSGKYAGKYGQSIEFKSGKAYLAIGGMTQEFTYDTDGDKVTLHNPGSPANGMVLTVNGDGTLSGVPGMGSETLKKQ